MYYMITAYDVPSLKKSEILLNEVKIGETSTLKAAIKTAEKWSDDNRFVVYKGKPFPSHLLYISEWDDEDDELNEVKSLDEWCADLL